MTLKPETQNHANYYSVVRVKLWLFREDGGSGESKPGHEFPCELVIELWSLGYRWSRMFRGGVLVKFLCVQQEQGQGRSRGIGEVWLCLKELLLEKIRIKKIKCKKCKNEKFKDRELKQSKVSQKPRKRCFPRPLLQGIKCLGNLMLQQGLSLILRDPRGCEKAEIAAVSCSSKILFRRRKGDNVITGMEVGAGYKRVVWNAEYYYWSHKELHSQVCLSFKITNMHGWIVYFSIYF